MWKWMGLMAAIGLLAASASAQDAIGPFSSGPNVMAYAVSYGCLPYLRYGTPLETSLKGKAGQSTLDGKPQFLMRGLGQVSVQIDARGGCYVMARRGNGADFRDAVMKALSEDGLKVEAFADYDSHLRDRHWSYVQELHCFRMDDQVYDFVMSSEADGKGVPMQITLLKDNDGSAAKKGLCLA